MNKEKIASTTTRLLHHLDRLQEIQKENLFRPITLHIAPTDICNLQCCFCSVKNREMKELGIDMIKTAIDKYVAAGILSVEITGGGEPTLYPEINELLSYCLNKKVKIGLITNGFKLKEIDENILKKISWIRISMNSIDCDLEFDIKDACLNTSAYVGMSYVWNEKTTEKALERVYQISKQCNVKYVRVVPNCNEPEYIEEVRRTVPPMIEKYDNFFLQIKSYAVHPNCYMGRLKPFLNSDGYIYHCSTNPLFEGKFGEGFKMGKIEFIDEFISNPPNINTKLCKLCFYTEQNMLIDAIKSEIITPEFV